MAKPGTSSTRRLLATCLGDCVHVAGVRRFLELAAEAGYETRFLGAAQPAGAVVEAVRSWRPDVLALSYRLTPEALVKLLETLLPALAEARGGGMRLIFGGPDPNCAAASATGAFEATFGSGATEMYCRAYLRGEEVRRPVVAWPQDLVGRIEAKAPRPLLRHHFGQPTVEQTVEGAAAIASAGAIDVLSLGPDQNAQASFFRPEEMDPAQDGAGGVPLRSEEDLGRIYEATRTGNYPLVRCYSGTRDVMRMADVLARKINNAWGAIPLFWYNLLDLRSDRPLRESIAEGQSAIGWHAERGIPVEVNDSHQWSLRSAPDAVAVASFYLAAYNAKALGVREYVGQFMFNTPAGMAPDMDLAKMLAKLAITGELQEGGGFRIWRETRTGLASLPAEEDAAIGHMCGSIAMQLALRPHIVHVVSYSEAHHAATTGDVIKAARIAAGVIDALWAGYPDVSRDPAVQARRDELIGDARRIVAAIRELAPPGAGDPLTHPETLARAVECGLLDAPDLAGNPAAWGRTQAKLIGGACLAVGDGGSPLAETARVAESLLRAREIFR